MYIREYIKEGLGELWNPENRIWQYIDRILFVLLPILFLIGLLKPSGESESWNVVANLTWIIPLSIWLLFLLLVIPYKLASKYYAERNEARALLVTKPKPVLLSNRQQLIEAIHTLQDTARDTILRDDMMRIRRNSKLPFAQEAEEYNTAYAAYWESEKDLDTQVSVVGQAFRKPIIAFKNEVKLYVVGREIQDAPEYPEIIQKLSEAVQVVESDIDAISQ